MPRLSTPLLLAGVPALAILVLGGAAFFYAQQGLWVKVFFPVLALVAPMGLMVALKLTESEKKTRDFAAENVESQKLLGLSFQEKGMLDMALATFNKLPVTEDMKLVFVNLGLDYENRGQRDKAQLAYKKVFDVDPAFEDVAQRMERVGPSGSGSFAATPYPARGPHRSAGVGAHLRPIAPRSDSPSPRRQPSFPRRSVSDPRRGPTTSRAFSRPRRRPTNRRPRRGPNSRRTSTWGRRLPAAWGRRPLAGAAEALRFSRAGASAATRSSGTSAAAAWATSTWCGTPSSTARPR